MAYKSITHRKLQSICFYNNMEKVKRNWLYLVHFSLRRARVTSDVIFTRGYALASTSDSGVPYANESLTPVLPEVE